MSRKTIHLPLLQDAEKRNKKYLLNVRKGLDDLSKNLLATLAANALNHAITAAPAGPTVHDSSRFAANWDLSLKAGAIRVAIDPAKYLQAGESYGAVGKKGDGGKYKDAVKSAKAAFYGYTASSHGHVEVIVGGRIHAALGVGKAGAAPSVYLYNPIIGRIGPYTKNALGGHDISVSPGLRTSMPYEVGKKALGVSLTKLYRDLKKL